MRVWRALCDIKLGETTSYGCIAQALGRSQGARAGFDAQRRLQREVAAQPRLRIRSGERRRDGGEGTKQDEHGEAIDHRRHPVPTARAS